jgi:7-cyano-7-deazaguanine synthase
MPKAAVVLLSGGMDSTVLLHHVAKELARAPIHALSYDYGQRHARELDSAAWQAQRAGVAHYHVIDISFLGELVKAGTTLVSAGAAVPDLDQIPDAQLSQPPTYVPNRNMMLLSIAAAYAEARGIRDVFYGAQAHDEYGYWDCTAEFLARLNHTLALNRGDRVDIHAPFVGLKKSALIPLGIKLSVDYSHTWSCYRGGKRACGTCPTCVERLKSAGARETSRLFRELHAVPLRARRHSLPHPACRRCVLDRVSARASRWNRLRLRTDCRRL